MVHRRHHGHTELGDLQQPGAEALVVVYDVEVGQPIGQHPCGPQAEGARLGEAGRPGRQQLQQVDAALDLVRPRNAERIGFAVEIEAGHLRQAHPRVEPVWIGLTGEHLDVVAQLDEATAQMADIDALSTAVRLAPVGQQGNAHTQFTPDLREARLTLTTCGRSRRQVTGHCPDYSLTGYLTQRGHLV